MSLAGDLDLVVGESRGFLNYVENTGTPTTPVFVFQDFFPESYSYLYDDDYVDDDGDVATVPPSSASSDSYLYDDLYADDYVDDDDVATVPPSSASSDSYLYDDLYADDYVDDDDVATVPPSSTSSFSYLYDDDYVGDDNAARRRVTSSQSNYWNPFDGVDVGWDSGPALGDFDGDGTLRPRPSIAKLRSHLSCLSQAIWTS